jgi:uncharacterized membrane protein YcjF (UPF0283 family)
MRWKPHFMVAVMFLVSVFTNSLSYSLKGGFSREGWMLFGISVVVQLVLAAIIFRVYRKIREMDKIVAEIKSQNEGR